VVLTYSVLPVRTSDPALQRKEIAMTITLILVVAFIVLTFVIKIHLTPRLHFPRWSNPIPRSKTEAEGILATQYCEVRGCREIRERLYHPDEFETMMID